MDSAGVRAYGSPCIPETSLASGPAPTCTPWELSRVLSSQVSASAEKGLRLVLPIGTFRVFLQAEFVLATSAWRVVTSVLLCLTPDHFSHFLTTEIPGGRGKGSVTHGMGGVETGSLGSGGANPLKQPLWLEKTLAGLHLRAQPCLWAAGTHPGPRWPPKCKAKATLWEHLCKAVFVFQRGEQG